MNLNQEYQLLSPAMMTSSNGNIFRITGPLCGEYIGHRWIPLTKASDAELWCFLWSASERLSKQLERRWFETPPRSLWRHCNDDQYRCETKACNWQIDTMIIPNVQFICTATNMVVRCIIGIFFPSRKSWRHVWYYSNQASLSDYITNIICYSTYILVNLRAPV